MRGSRNLVAAFLAAPLISAILSILLTPTAVSLDGVAILGMLGLFYLVSMSITLLFGVPIYCLFLYLEKINWITCLGGGLSVGVVVGLILHFPTVALFRELSVMGAIGGASGIVFWLIWRSGRDVQALEAEESG